MSLFYFCLWLMIMKWCDSQVGFYSDCFPGQIKDATVHVKTEHSEHSPCITFPFLCPNFISAFFFFFFFLKTISVWEFTIKCLVRTKVYRLQFELIPRYLNERHSTRPVWNQPERSRFQDSACAAGALVCFISVTHPTASSLSFW